MQQILCLLVQYLIHTLYGRQQTLLLQTMSYRAPFSLSFNMLIPAILTTYRLKQWPISSSTTKALAITLLTYGFIFSPIIFAAEEYLVKDFRDIDQSYLEHALDKINDVTSEHFGTHFKHDKEHDLNLLQRLLDENIIKSQHVALLQAMGVVLGELYRQEYPLEWVRYLDKEGQSRALKLRHYPYFIFPITSISRRVEVGLTFDIKKHFRETIDLLRVQYER